MPSFTVHSLQAGRNYLSYHKNRAFSPSPSDAQRPLAAGLKCLRPLSITVAWASRRIRAPPAPARQYALTLGDWMDEYRVPTVQVEVELLCLDGRTLWGQIFMPALSALHAGAMAPEEWINGVASFFPFKTRHGAGILFNKQHVLALTVMPPATVEPSADGLDGLSVELPVQRVAVEAGDHRFEGRLVIDMPLNQRRVLDYVNRPEAFLLLHRDDGRRCLIQKACIASVADVRGA